MSRGARTVVVALGLTAPYVPFVLGRGAGDGPAAAACLAAAVVAAPGAAGALWAGAGAAPFRAAGALVAAALLNVGAVVVLRALGAAPTPPALAAALGTGTVALGAAAAAARGVPRPGAATGWLAGAGAFALFAFAGLGVVPPLEDQDFEVQATANGLVRDLDPVCLTNRSRLHFFAHPPLLHFLAASSLTLHGDLDTVRPPYDVARAELAKAPGAPERGFRAIVRALRDPPPVTDRSRLWFEEVFRPFRADPALLGTRAPNFALGALAVVLVLTWARRLGASALDALLVTACYATIPEVFVRSGYGGYYAASATTMLVAAWLAAEGAGRSAAFAGAIAVLVNHKALIVGAAAALHRGVRRAAFRERLGPAGPLILGLAVGSAAFWIWGLAIAPADFVGEHLLDHGLRRFAGGAVTTAAGRAVYPSRIGVWAELVRNTGWAWAVVALVGLGWGLRRAVRPPEERSPGEAPVTAAAAGLAAWVVIGAVLFTLTDWRQTKHLMLLVPALAVLAAAALARARRGPRLALRGALVVALAWNVVWIVRLADSFRALRVTPIW